MSSASKCTACCVSCWVSNRHAMCRPDATAYNRDKCNYREMRGWVIRARVAFHRPALSIIPRDLHRRGRNKLGRVHDDAQYPASIVPARIIPGKCRTPDFLGRSGETNAALVARNVDATALSAFFYFPLESLATIVRERRPLDVTKFRSKQ